MTKEKKLIESLDGTDIYFDTERAVFTATHKTSGETEEGPNIWPLRQWIRDQDRTSSNITGLIPAGYFGKGIAKIRVTQIKKSNDEVDYIITEDTEHSYDEGKKQDNHDLKAFVIYPMSKENLELFEQVKKLEGDITAIENQQKALVNKLNDGKKLLQMIKEQKKEN